MYLAGSLSTVAEHALTRITRKGLQSKRATASLLIKRNQLVLIQSVWLVESRAVEFYGVGLVCQGCLIVIAPH